MSLLKVPHQTQIEDSWCLPACVAMVCAYWGRPEFQGDIARWLQTTEIGTPARNISRLKDYGFDATYLEGSLQFLSESLQQSIPCILFLRTGELPYWEIDTAHAIVVIGLDDQEIFLNDPFFEDAPKVVPVEEVLLAWSSI